MALPRRPPLTQLGVLQLPSSLFRACRCRPASPRLSVVAYLPSVASAQPAAAFPQELGKQLWRMRPRRCVGDPILDADSLRAPMNHFHKSTA